ncbi:uncharacterized protein LOC110099649 [Dendrobium catenatum]|uniref:uncharacterized protein LOC110099649 n=1 Tax=Dendrobium catenatum TaxID=906689 RepID=UPI0009F53C7D|nr:uncharacterized protein LOC110099649 [Dendrobium catenatum]
MEKVEDLEEFVVKGERGFSECSSGCQSGWTLYLCQSHDSPSTSTLPSGGEVSVHEDEEEDLSMLSDASSGPPHGTEETCIKFYYCSNDRDLGLSAFARNGVSKRRKAEEKNLQKQRRLQEHSSFLDDTASSPLLCFSEATSSISSSSRNHLVDDVLELSCGFSANHCKKEAALKNHIGNYLQSSAALNQAPNCRQEDENNLL